MKIILKKILFRTFIIFLIFNTLQPKFLALLKKCKSMGKILKINELDISKFFRIFLALAPYFFSYIFAPDLESVTGFEQVRCQTKKPVLRLEIVKGLILSESIFYRMPRLKEFVSHFYRHLLVVAIYNQFK